MQRVLRGVSMATERFVIGEAPPQAERSRLHRPPPPLPPPTEPDQPDEPFAASDHGWTDPWTEPAAAETTPLGPHPAEEETMARLAEAEGLLLAAQEETDRVLAAARSEAEELRAQAFEELARARAEADELRQSAAESAEQVREEARAAGHAAGLAEGQSQGYAEGLARAEQETSERVAAVVRLAESAAVDRRELLRNAEGEVVRLAIQIARKVLARELQLDPATVTRIAEAALQLVAIDGLIKLRVNPADHELLSAYWQRAHGATQADRTYEVVADEAVTPGGVVIDTRAGTIDARIDSQVEEISQKIFGEAEVVAS